MTVILGVLSLMLVNSCVSQNSQFNPGGSNLPFLSAKGTKIVDEDGKTIILKGANFGSWLNKEMWMMDIKDDRIEDQYSLEKIFEDRFGKQERDNITEIFRENWITERDFRTVKSFGFNCIRVPFHYALLEDDEKPMQLKPNAFKWLDYVVNMAKMHNLYVIFDLHCAAGSQNEFDHSGRINWNKFWDDKAYWERTKWLWKQIADRYKNSPTVAGYQPINEPWGGELEDQAKIFDELYKAIREVDKKHLVISSAHFTGFDHFGDPKDNGWTNVCYSQNFYPGLFGGGASNIESHRGFFIWLDDFVVPKLEKIQTPFLVTEFNVVFNKAGSAQMMRRHFEEYARHDWAATMWSYKLVTSPGKKVTGGWWLITNTGEKITGGWWLVTNKGKLPKIDYLTASLDEIKDYYRSFSTMEYLVRDDLRQALSSTEKLPPLEPPAPLEPIKVAPANDEFKGWTITDIAGALKGGQKVHSDTAIDLYGGGADAWAYADQLRYVWKKVKGDFELSVTVDYFTFTDMYAKAGVMVRESLDPNSAIATSDILPDGNVEVLIRAKTGEHMASAMVMGTELPGINLKIVRKGKIIERYFSSGKMEWSKIDQVELPDLPEEVYAGIFCLSHDNNQLAKAVFRNIKLTKK